MELWYTEEHTENVRFCIKIKDVLYNGKSPYQKIEILDSVEFGKILTLDGLIMLTEKDEFIYHDMIVHIPMAVKPNMRKVLVIGGGDGGTIRELTRYKTIEKIHLVEIDKLVVDVCKEYLPETASKLDEARVELYFENGLKFIRSQEDEYDLIIVDSTDPFGPGEGLFTREFYGNCYKALKEDGIMVNQLESPYYSLYISSMKKAYRNIKEFFPIAKVYQAHIPTYPSGYWLFGFASKKYHPIDHLKEEEWNRLSLKTKYYNTELHKGAFALPNYVKELLEYE